MTAVAKRGAKAPRPGSKGERTREAILAHALALATRIGFEGLTIGRLAEDLHMSKSGLFAHFRSKEALQVETINNAFLTFEEKLKGSIEPGKLADFAVLSEDLLTVEAAKIPAMRTLLTYVGGREVFRDAAMK